jgi:glycosyltransferase involved in cell wall biosynthesis
VKVALVSEHASPLACLGGVDAGGQNVHVAALATALARRGDRVEVYTRADRPTLPRRVRMAPGVDVVHVAAGPAAPVPKDDLLAFMPAFADELERAWQDDPPDVVHAHFWMSGWAASRALAGSGVPLLQTFHALGTVKRRWQGVADTSPAERLDIEAGLARSVDRIIATCRDEVGELRAMGATDTAVDVVPCGVDLELFAPDLSASEAVQPPRLLLLGRLVARKGLADAICAMRDIPGAELVIAGGPDAADLDTDPEAVALTALARQVGVADRVRLIGRVARPQLPALIRSCALVLAVPWYEPFGIVPLEAMASGVPVVASAVGGLTDTVVDGVTGVLVPPREPAALAAAVNRLLADEPLRATMGRAGLHRARARYGWDDVARSTTRSYAAALAAPVVGAGRAR